MILARQARILAFAARILACVRLRTHELSRVGKLRSVPELPATDERAARVRAALAYKFPSTGDAKVRAATQAAALGWDYDRNSRPFYSLIDGDEALWRAKVDRLAEVTGVPRWFFDFGFRPPVKTGAQELRKEITDLRVLVGSLAADVARLTEGRGER